LPVHCTGGEATAAAAMPFAALVVMISNLDGMSCFLRLLNFALTAFVSNPNRIFLPTRRLPIHYTAREATASLPVVAVDRAVFNILDGMS
jgi:hypothetical protein